MEEGNKQQQKKEEIEISVPMTTIPFASDTGPVSRVLNTASPEQRQAAVTAIRQMFEKRAAEGKVEMSTCCSNTATENAMMARLMIDSVKTWATQYRIDSFRFDLMGHQPRSVMEALKAEVDAAAGRSIFLIGEGWNFGEVANGARFVQASQLSRQPKNNEHWVAR